MGAGRRGWACVVGSSSGGPLERSLPVAIDVHPDPLLDRTTVLEQLDDDVVAVHGELSGILLWPGRPGGLIDASVRPGEPA